MLNVKKTLTKIMGVMDDMVVIESHTISNISYSTYYGTSSLNVAKAGYTPIALGNASMNIAQNHFFYLGISGNTASFGVCRNAASGTISNLTITFTVVYIRSDLM